MDLRTITTIILLSLSINLLASFDCLTPEERAEVLTALDMASEYRQLLDGGEARRIEEIVRVSGDTYRVRLLLVVKSREIRRDVYIEVKGRSPPSWPWILAGFGAGILTGFLIAK